MLRKNMNAFHIHLNLMQKLFLHRNMCERQEILANKITETKTYLNGNSKYETVNCECEIFNLTFNGI